MSNWFYKKLSCIIGWMAIAVLFGLIIFSANIEIKDLDLWLHLAAGRFIVDHGAIPQMDVLSFVLSGTPWINHEWLFQVIVHWIYQAGGADGLILMQVIVVTLTFLLLLILGCRHERQFAPTFILLLVLLVYQLRMTFRPDIYSLLFLTIYIFILCLFARKRSSLLILFFVQILWVNMHGFFILGPLIVGIGFVSEWGKRHFNLPFAYSQIDRLTDEEYKMIKQLLLVVIAACFINPYGWAGVWYPFHVMFEMGSHTQIFFEQITELQKPIQWNVLFSLAQYPYYKLLIIISLLSFLLNYRRINIGVLLSWMIFLTLSLMAVRNIVFFAIAAYVAFISNLQYLTVATNAPIQFTKQKFQALTSILFKGLLIVWMLQLASSMTLRGYFDFDRFERKSEYGGISLRNYPIPAADFLVENNIKGNFFNNFNAGAYLLGRTHPQIKVFMDGRTEVYGPDLFKQYKKAWKGNAELLDQLTEKYQLTGAFISFVHEPAPKKLLQYFYNHPKWTLVYFDYDAVIFLRDVLKNRALIKKHAINLSQWKKEPIDLIELGGRRVTPYRHAQRATALYNFGFKDKASKEAEEALRVSPRYAQPYKLLAKISLDDKKYEKAYKQARKAKVLNPRDTEARYLLAQSFYHLGEFDQARKECRKVLKVYPKSKKARELLEKLEKIKISQ